MKKDDSSFEKTKFYNASYSFVKMGSLFAEPEESDFVSKLNSLYGDYVDKQPITYTASNDYEYQWNNFSNNAIITLTVDNTGYNHFYTITYKDLDISNSVLLMRNPDAKIQTSGKNVDGL